MESQYGYYDPDGDADWFPPNPLDSMPIATDNGGFDWEDTAPSEYEPPTEAEMPAELMEVPTSVKNPKPQKPEKKEESIHEKMYEIATARYNPFSLGGSENCDSDVTCNIGGSENLNSR
tara:strand:+ start:945 stop:1301 length:357 start_codon:yes stop_codon:yes gene_type:complete